MSSAQRLLNGNTLITEGSNGRLIEVTKENRIVWEYISPYQSSGLEAHNKIYRAYRVPYDWLPQLSKGSEIALPDIDNRRFHIKG
ncbi:arylsulfotransferase family protein [Providencia stuartii]|uniref:arylsulfotransferase family protein n=1 Tax=Providencia stuartii TaxID=588 RepID=UPI00214D3BFE|nr:arylsulfotransferase family protein [Providencia stuartii]